MREDVLFRRLVQLLRLIVSIDFPLVSRYLVKAVFEARQALHLLFGLGVHKVKLLLETLVPVMIHRVILIRLCCLEHRALILASDLNVDVDTLWLNCVPS